MPAETNLTLLDRGPDPARLCDEVLRGLLASPKATPPEYFYDEAGARIFEEICELPEYYLTRTETRILRTEAAAIAPLLGPRCLLIELGSGSSRKVRLLLDAMEEPAGYVAVDVARDEVVAAARHVASDYPRLPVTALCGDFTALLPLPALPGAEASRRVLFFPGSTIGNLGPEACLRFLRQAVELVGAGGGMLLGVDLKKDRTILEPAYDDAAGVTARFNLNLLHRINREMGGTFDVAAFQHRAFYDDRLGRIEMHLVSRVDQTVTVAGRAIAFAAGETIHTESSYKYAQHEMEELARAAGFRPARTFTDAARLFAVLWLEVA